jgi:hypothetical protein
MIGACRTASSGCCDPVRLGATFPSAVAREPPVTTASWAGRLTAGQTHDGQIADRLLDHLGLLTIMLADKAYDAD